MVIYEQERYYKTWHFVSVALTVGDSTAVVINLWLLLFQRLHCELPDAIIRQIPDCGHLPHVETPSSVVKFIVEFVQKDTKSKTINQRVSPVWRLNTFLPFSNSEGNRTADILEKQPAVIELNMFMLCQCYYYKTPKGYDLWTILMHIYYCLVIIFINSVIKSSLRRKLPRYM